jgi:Flp pilus assembly protein TadG
MTLHRERHGSALVEFALIAPILILLIVGILDVSRGVNAYVTVRNAGAEATHWAALHPTVPVTEIEAKVRERVVPLDASAVTVSARFHEQGETWDPWPDAGIARDPAAARTVTIAVEASYPWSAVTFIGRFIPGATFTSRSIADALVEKAP